VCERERDVYKIYMCRNSSHGKRKMDWVAGDVIIDMIGE
jgi:hypothetical protein